MPRIDETFQSIDGFDYATALDLPDAFYHIPLHESAQKVFTFVVPWGKYSHLRMPQGYSGSPDEFQKRMDLLLGDLPYCAAFIDDIAIWTKGTFDDHLNHLRTVLQRLRDANLRVNLKKSFFICKELKYLGFIFSKEGIRSDPKKIEAIQSIIEPRNRKELRSFLGMCNYLRTHIPRYSHHSAPLTDLLKNPKAKFIWTEEANKSFHTLKSLIMREVMLSFPDYDKIFYIFTDASDLQIGAVIVQRDDNGKLKRPIAFFSKKMNDTQTRYTTTEQELLAIVEVLRAFRTMLLGREIVIYTDHKNLTFERFSSDRVFRWRQYVEEFGPKLVYLPGENNVVADALSRLPRTPNEVDFIEEQNIMEEVFNLDVLKACPIDLRVISRIQKKEIPKTIYNRLPSTIQNDIELKINSTGKVVVPHSLRMPMLEFYHENLRHPGVVKMAESILMNFTWDGLRKDCEEFVSHCEQCQRFKNKKNHYGHLPLADARTDEPWSHVAVDLIGPWAVKAKNCTFELKCLTMIDLATRWIEIVRIHDKSSENIALLFDRVWLSRYPRPLKVIHDQGTEFKSEFTELLDSLGIEDVTTTIKNPRANAILERTHDVIANMLRTYDFENQMIDGKDVDWGTAKTDPLDGFISAVALAMRASHHSALGTSPGAIVFGRDMFFPTKYVANWQAIRQRRTQDMKRRLMRENQGRKPFKYQAGQLVLIRHDMDGPTFKGKMANPTKGPFRIVRVIGDHTLELQKGRYLEKVNIRRVQPFFDKHPTRVTQPSRTAQPARRKSSRPAKKQGSLNQEPNHRSSQQNKMSHVERTNVRRSNRARRKPTWLEQDKFETY
jgi:cleavage and polyadenylation specificity factor subunit 1